ncbi:hypothetical protein EJB05_29182, partial [Eragrostis curvula]
MTNPSSRRKRANHERRAAAGAVASYPPSVLLYFWGQHEDDTGSCSAAEAKTMAAARTTAGEPIRVSFRFAAPPEVSRLLIGFPGGSPEKHGWPNVMAAQGDSVLFQISLGKEYPEDTNDHFIYNAGVASGPNPRPPTLSLLPPYYLTEKELARGYYRHGRPTHPICRYLDPKATGLARRGEDEFVLAELKIVDMSDYKTGGELLRLRSGKWSVERPMITSHGRNKPKLAYWEGSTVFALRDGLLCWVDITCGLFFSNVFDEIPELQYVPLPVKLGDVCVTSGGSTVKCVKISPRCCCGGKGATKCRHSRHSYTIQTWMLRLDDMVWVMDGIVDSTEIWGLDGYKDLPRVPLVCPVVSLDHPHIICFEVCEQYAKKKGDPAVWLIVLDLRSKAVLSACRSHNGGYGRSIERYMISAGISDYFNLYPSSNDSLSISKSHLNFVEPPTKKSRPNNDESSGQSSCKTPVDPVIQVSEILNVLKEIPSYGLADGDMPKVISILSDDNGRRFRSLLNLPVRLRKNWLLMEIKANEA